MNTIQRPALRYFGGKWKLSDWIISHFPAHRVYVESFGGGASVLINKPVAELEVYNDLSGDAVNFFRVLRDQPAALIRLIELTPYSRQELREAKTAVSECPLERARLFFVRINQKRVGGDNSGWRSIKRITNSNPLQQWNTTEHLHQIAWRLKHVYIEEMDALSVIEAYDAPDCLHYVDPPYVLSTRGTHRYEHEISPEYQERLAGALLRCRGMVVLSGYRSVEYDEWFGGWRRVDKRVTTGASNNEKSERGMATESLWINSAAQKKGLFLFEN